MTSSFENREILLGVTGGIAAYKSAELCSRMVQQGGRVTVVMTAAARRFIGEATFQALTNRPVHWKRFSPQEHPLGEHIGLGRRADILVIAPATADFLAKLAHGFADDLLSTLYLAFTGKVVVAPAMNAEMWSKPAVQRNIAQLQADGVQMIDPQPGWLSCGQVGPGRMAEPADILLQLAAQLDALSASGPAH